MSAKGGPERKYRSAQREGMPVTRLPRRQRGITLVVAMILLALITLIAATTFGVGQGSMQVVGSLQHRSDVLAAAQEAIETAISTIRLVESPEAILSPGCGGTANTTCVDLNGDGVDDVTVALHGRGGVGNPGCVKSQVIPNKELMQELVANPANLEPLYCTVEADQTRLGLLSPNTNSLCTAAIIEVVAVATDATTQASVTVTEGVSMRVPTENVSNTCP